MTKVTTMRFSDSGHIEKAQIFFKRTYVQQRFASRARLGAPYLAESFTFTRDRFLVEDLLAASATIPKSTS